MKLSGPACTEAMNEAEEDGTRERTEDNAGGVRVELGVRHHFDTETEYILDLIISQQESISEIMLFWFFSA